MSPLSIDLLKAFLITFTIEQVFALVAPGSDPSSPLSECPQPKELPAILFGQHGAGGAGKPRLKVQRNFNKMTLWSWSAGSIDAVPSNLLNLGTVENAQKVDRSDSSNYSIDFELDDSIQLKVGWYAACGGYDYVVDGTRATCSMCSLFKLCRSKQNSVAEELDLAGPPPTNGRHSRHAHHHNLKTCEEQMVTMLPDVEYTKSSMLATFAVGDLPLLEAKLSVKVSQPNLCIPDRKMIFDLEYTIFPNTFVVVNITGLELGKIYALVFQPVGHLKFATISQRVNFSPTTKHFRMPTLSALCSVDGGEEILANQLWPMDNNNRLNPYRPIDRHF